MQILNAVLYRLAICIDVDVNQIQLIFPDMQANKKDSYNVSNVVLIRLNSKQFKLLSYF